MEKNNEKRVLRVELNDDVKKITITGTDSDEQVVMRQELSEDELDVATGGYFLVNQKSQYTRPCSSISCPYDH